MVKGTELWDDSALISAFDTAMTSYKEMHTECLHGRTLDQENDDKDIKESDTELSKEAKCGRQIESEGNNPDMDSNLKETSTPSCNNAASTNHSSTQANDIGAYCSVPEFNPPLKSVHPSANPRFDGYSDHQNLNYDELLKQYYELEHRKEKIAEQLWQANYWNYQTPVQCPTSKQQQVSVSSGSELGPNTLFNCTSQCPMNSALSLGCACCPLQVLCCSGSQVQQEAGGAHSSTSPAKCSRVPSFSMNPMNHFVQVDGRAVETGAMPVELASDSVMADLSRVCNLHEETKNGEDDAPAKDLSSTSQKTDLTSVINAWYWAGYHTGRYLLEQEQSDKLNNHSLGGQQRAVSKEKDSCN